MNWPLFILSCVAGYLLFIACRHLHVRRLVRKFQAKLRQIEDVETEHEAEPSPPVLGWDDREFQILNLRKGAGNSARWIDVRSASAYKMDLYSYDLVCVAFELDNDTSIEISETMNGFSDLMEATPNYLPGFLAFSDWYMNITTPAFETNLTPLFERPQV